MKAHSRNKITMPSSTIIFHGMFYHILVNLKWSSRLKTLLFVMFLLGLWIVLLLTTSTMKLCFWLLYMWVVRGQLVGISSFLPPCGSGCQAWWQEPFPLSLLGSPALYLWVIVIKLYIHLLPPLLLFMKKSKVRI